MRKVRFPLPVGRLPGRKRIFRLIRKLLRTNPRVRYFVPDGRRLWVVLAEVTDLAIIVHFDDGEIGCVVPILQCYESQMQLRNAQANGNGTPRRFCLVVITTGAGCPRGGRYANYPDQKMVETRWREQQAAAMVGHYPVINLSYSSPEVKDVNQSRAIVRDLLTILHATGPQRVFTHSLSDPHETHVAGALRTIEAVRSLPIDAPLQALFGVEIWGCLDWLGPGLKVSCDISGSTHLAASLVGLFDSQIHHGKDYLRATQGIRAWHATTENSHDVDKAREVAIMMDMTNLIIRRDIDPAAFMEDAIAEFAGRVAARIRKLSTTSRGQDRVSGLETGASIDLPLMPELPASGQEA